jgi:hypothetical protein
MVGAPRKPIANDAVVATKVRETLRTVLRANPWDDCCVRVLKSMWFA